MKTIFHLAGAAFWSAPWSLAGILFLGFLLLWFSATFPEYVIVAILRALRRYSNLHYRLYVWLVTSGIPIVAVVQTMVIASTVAVLVKGRELVASIILGLFFAVPIRSPLSLLFCAQNTTAAASYPSYVISCGLAINAIAIVLAGVIVRMCRSTEASRVRVASPAARRT